MTLQGHTLRYGHRHNTCIKYLKYILDSVNEFNGCYIGWIRLRKECFVYNLFCTQVTFVLILSSTDIHKHNKNGRQLLLNVAIKSKNKHLLFK